MADVHANGIRSGLWQGKEGSILHLKVMGDQISGLYQTAQGSPDLNENFNVTGFTDGEFIGFVVLWKGHFSVTSWTGRYGRDSDGEYITCMWHLVHKYHDKARKELTEEWDSFMSNQGRFYYQGDDATP